MERRKILARKAHDVMLLYYLQVDRDSSVGIATHYGMDGPGLNPGMGKIFYTRPDRSWGPPSLLYNWYRSFPGGNRPGRGDDYPPTSSAEFKERVELYLYTPYGPSWPVLWRTLTFIFTFTLLESRTLGYITVQ
jgi:hypothetical protein